MNVVLIVACLFLMDSSALFTQTRAGATILQAPKKIRTVVTGFGKTESMAESDARRNASIISPTYTVVRKSFGGSKGNYSCTLVIEYRE
ncbi:MAG: hypothetical protein SNJ82_08640 [Gemmataceae bacterium]